MIKRIGIIILVVAVLLLGGFFYFRYPIYYSHGNSKDKKTFEIVKGESNNDVAEKLEKENLISGKWYFYFYMNTNKLTGKILPGKYEINETLTIPEIASIITQKKEEDFIEVTFPEGFDSQKMAERLSTKGFDGDGFLKLVKNPPAEMKNKYLFPDDKNISSLEGYLFPDTYFLKPETSAENIISKMLDNFNGKISLEMRNEIKKKNKTLPEIITMASIIEKEAIIDYVNNKNDVLEKTISGIFWNRIKNGQGLQSCATLAYILGEDKYQYSFEDTRIDSPYNTYIIKGLPPGPISNPGIYAILASIYPNETEYNYFLSDKSKNIIFSKTLDEHNANKVKFGL